MEIPKVLSVREARQGLTGVIRRLKSPGAKPVLVGAHRKAEVVIMSVAEYERLVAAQMATANSVASNRLEGLTASEDDVALLTRIESGEITYEEAIQLALNRPA